MRTHPDHASPCGWNALLPPRTPTATVDGSIHCDLAVVGAGYTGLAAARAWAERRPEDDVRVLEASTVGEGSPGRNSGFLLEIALAEDADAGAVARMARINALTRESMEALRALVRDHQIDARLERRGTYRAAATARGAAAVDAYGRFLEAAGLAHERLDAKALADRLGTRHYRTGLWSPDCSLAQPAALIRGLADALPANVTLHEQSPVLALEAAADGHRLRTPRGEVQARRVLLANNGWAGALGAAADRLTPVYTYAALTEPMPERLEGSDPEWGLLPAAKLGTTLRRTDDGRLLVRSLYSYREEAAPTIVEARLRASMVRRWPALADAPFAHVWGGTTGITWNGAPVFAAPAEGVLVAAGCNGGGVVKGTLLGELLVRAALGEQIPDVGELFGRADRVPPDPIRRIGFAALTALWRWQAGAEA
ncbi:MAG: FAD-binding oxidoreductase [Pseudomonadales bacterium]|jgi:glycine/D-amino acid oxidase-like deaminating enzyme|nr:FAD-binding oxidoreductase [Pseudomonadales bacterium]